MRGALTVLKDVKNALIKPRASGCTSRTDFAGIAAMARRGVQKITVVMQTRWAIDGLDARSFYLQVRSQKETASHED